MQLITGYIVEQKYFFFQTLFPTSLKEKKCNNLHILQPDVSYCVDSVTGQPHFLSGGGATKETKASTVRPIVHGNLRIQRVVESICSSNEEFLTRKRLEVRAHSRDPISLLLP